jgi:hypothetical protein
MSINYYRFAIETLGMRSAKNTVLNRFNKVAAQSTDSTLQQLALDVITELRATSSLPENVPTSEMRAVPSADKLMKYCKDKATQADL